MGYFAVIDTETNWHDQVMSIGIVIAREDTFRSSDSRYFVLTPEYQVGGMFSDALFSESGLQPDLCSRRQVVEALRSLFEKYGVDRLFAYNASFDRNHLPELRDYTWYDIMRFAAYRQYNPRIPMSADCCSTGRLKRGYGVESMLRLLSGNSRYRETHNALDDALDELEIMRLLGHRPECYLPL